MLKELLFTHTDMDGVGCRIIYTAMMPYTLGSEINIVSCDNYNVDALVSATFNDRDDIDTSTIIRFADIVCCRELLTSIRDRGFRVIVTDHHRTNLWVTQELPEEDAIVIPETPLGIMESGTSLLFADLVRRGLAREFEGNSTKAHIKYTHDFVDTVRSYDTYEWKKTNNLKAYHLQTLFKLLGPYEFANTYIDRIKSPTYEGELIEMGDQRFVKAKIEAEQRGIDKFSMNDITIIQVLGGKYTCGVCLRSLWVNISELANQFLMKHPELDFFAYWSMTDGGGWQFRAVKDNIDLGAEIAVPLGGGGHPKASGAAARPELAEAIKTMVLDELRNL